MIKFGGDISDADKRLAAELEKEEEYWNIASASSHYAKEIVAKAFVCLAHDWLEIGLEEKGTELIEKAERVCPGYFENTILLQTKSDEDFDILVKNIFVNLSWILINRVDMVKEDKQ